MQGKNVTKHSATVHQVKSCTTMVEHKELCENSRGNDVLHQLSRIDSPLMASCYISLLGKLCFLNSQYTVYFYHFVSVQYFSSHLVD